MTNPFSIPLSFCCRSVVRYAVRCLSDGLISCYVCWSFLLSLSFARSLATAPFSWEWTKEAEGTKEGRKEVRSGDLLTLLCGQELSKRLT